MAWATSSQTVLLDTLRRLKAFGRCVLGSSLMFVKKVHVTRRTV
ncbi:hypothetical protein O9929_06085 [Vibrio lentus]|nr:hypothetical protein [Vibrio lentus]